MQSPLVPRDWAGSRFGVGCGAVIPAVLPGTSRLAVLVLVEAAELWDCPNSSELALIFITVFAWAFVFFSSSEKSLDAVREGREGRCPCGPCGLQPCLAVLAPLKAAGLQRPPALPLELLPLSWVGPGWQEGAGRRDTFPWLLSPVTESTCCSLEPFAALTSDVSSMIYAPV